MSFEAPPPSSILPSWLREERAGVTLSEDEVQSLVELYGESLWTEANCVRTSVTYTSDSLRDVREMVVVIASEAVGKLVEKGKIADKEAHRVLANKKYVMWWMVPSRLWGGDAEEAAARPAQLTTTLAQQPIAPTPAAAPAIDLERAPSKQAIEDLRLQGVTQVEQLVQISVSMQVAQKVGMSECLGATYRSAVSNAAIIKRMNKSTKGVRTLDDLLRDAMVTGDITEVNRQIRRTVDRFVDDPEDRMFSLAGTKLGQMWSRALALNDEDGLEPRVAVKYCQLMLDEYSCRGLPEIDNFTLVREAERFPYGKHITKSQERESSSARGRPAQLPDTKFDEKMDLLIDTVTGVAKQQKKLSDGQDELREKCERTAKELGDLKSRVGRGLGLQDRDDREDRRREDKDKNKGKCKWCKQTGHYVSECPEMLKKLKEKKEEEDE